MAWAKNLIVGENIYGRFGTVIRNNQDAIKDVFPTIRIFSLVMYKRHFVQPTSHKSHIKNPPFQLNPKSSFKWNG
jgi:hypothetical protein